MFGTFRCSIPKRRSASAIRPKNPFCCSNASSRWSRHRAILCLTRSSGSGTTLVAAELLGRNSLGIDISPEAVSWRRQRLAEPFKTSSELLRKGRDSYIQSDEEALAYLHGLPIVPVQRNRGIDAILKTPPGENPVLIRVQRRGEPLPDAAEQLHNAGQSKQPATLILIVTDLQQPAGLFNMLPPEVLLVNSTAGELMDRLAGIPIPLAL